MTIHAAVSIHSVGIRIAVCITVDSIGERVVVINLPTVVHVWIAVIISVRVGIAISAHTTTFNPIRLSIQLTRKSRLEVRIIEIELNIVVHHRGIVGAERGRFRLRVGIVVIVVLPTSWSTRGPAPKIRGSSGVSVLPGCLIWSTKVVDVS